MLPLVVYPKLIPTFAAVVGTLKLTFPDFDVIAECAPAVVVTVDTYVVEVDKAQTSAAVSDISALKAFPLTVLEVGT